MRLANDAIKGTCWEPVLYPPPIDLATRKMIRNFHDALDKSEAEREQIELARLEEQRRKSAGFIADVVALKRSRTHGPEGEGA